MPDRDPKGLVKDWLEWTIGPLQDQLDLAVELIGNRDMLPPGTSGLGAIRQSFPHAPLSALKATPPFLKDPESHAAWAISTSNIYMRTIGDDEFVRVTGGDGDDDAVITQNRAIRRFFYTPGNLSNYWLMCGDATTFGIGWGENPVDTIHEMVYGLERRQLEDGATLPDFAPRSVTRKQVSLRHINWFDFHPDWAALMAGGQMMKAGAKVGRMGGADFIAWAAGFGDDAEAAAKRAVEKNDKTYHMQGEGRRWKELVIRGIDEADLNLPMRYRPIQFIHWGGIDPWSPVDSIERYRMIVIANDEVVIDKPHPYYPHLWRKISLPPMSGRAVPMSPLEVMRYEQDELDTWRTLRTKAGIKTVNAATLVDSSVFDDVSQFEEPASDQIITGKGIGVPGGLASAAQQMQHNYGWLFAADQLRQGNKDLAREGSGLVDVLRGVAAGGRTTKREIEEVSIQGNLPMNAQVDLIENEDLPAIARDVPQRWLFALRDDPEGEAKLRDLTGWDRAQLVHLARDLSIDFQGSARFNARAGMGGVINTVAAVLAANPAIANLINLPQIAVDLLKMASPDAAARYLLDPTSSVGQMLFSSAGAQGAPQRGVASPPRPPGGQ